MIEGKKKPAGDKPCLTLIGLPGCFHSTFKWLVDDGHGYGQSLGSVNLFLAPFAKSSGIQMYYNCKMIQAGP